jgi:hypothetical protein
MWPWASWYSWGTMGVNPFSHKSIRRQKLWLGSERYLALQSGKDKVKVSYPCALSTMLWRCMEEWRYSSIILDLCIRGRWMVSFTPWPLYTRAKSLRYFSYRRLGGIQSRFRRCELEKYLFTPVWKSNPGRPDRRYNDWTSSKNTNYVWRSCHIVLIVFKTKMFE